MSKKLKLIYYETIHSQNYYMHVGYVHYLNASNNKNKETKKLPLC